jgi:hypothetical protein
MPSQRKKIPQGTARMVLARSGGYCANPSCRKDLFPPIAPGRIATIDRLAHIIGQSPRGPRGDDPLPPEARDDGSNILLLCPNCHALVDGVMASDTFSPEVLRKWKRQHEHRVRHGASIPHFNDRGELDSEVRSLLRQNRAIWERYSPESEAGQDPFSELARTWREQILATIIPNNQRILELLDANRSLLSDQELEVVESFRLHAAALDLNYTSGERRAGAPRFPIGFDALFSA